MDEENKNNMEESNNSEEKTGSMNWMLVVAAVVLILGLGYYFMNMTTKKADEKTDVGVNSQMPAPDNNGEDVNEMVVENNEDQGLSVSVEGGMFYFKPNKIVVKKGQPVTITFTNAAGMHDFVIDDLDVKSEVIGAGESNVITFTPTEAGEFEFYCSVSDHKAKGMVGTLIVE